MVVESRAGRVAASALVLLAVFSSPPVTRNLTRIFASPGFDDRLFVTVDRESVHHNSAYGTVAPGVMDLWRQKSNSFSVFYPVERWVSPEGASTERISQGLIESTGVSPWRGRLPRFSPERELLASYEWTHGDSAWIGRSVQIGFHPYRITGIMPPRYRLLSAQTAFWMPIPAGVQHLEFVGQLKPGVSRSTATAELRDLSRKAHLWGTSRLEVITLRRNRQDDFLFAISVLQWNLLFVLLVAARGWLRFVKSGRREIANLLQARYLCLLLLKTAVVLFPLVLAWIIFLDPDVQKYFAGLGGWSVPIFFWFVLLVAWGLTVWSLRDQQSRCPVCCSHLRMPVGRGSWSSLVLDRPATESICIYGHGTLYVPGTHLLNLDSVNWTANRDIWQQLAV